MSTTTQIDTKVLEKTFAELKSAQYTIARSTAKTRKAKLRKLHDSILRNRDAMCEAMWNDFRKSPEEVDISEVICTNSEIRHAIKNLSHWIQHKPVPVRLPLFTTRSEIRYEPKGVCLIISPWNFPFNLSFIPLVSAVAAGNTVVIKPSEHTPHSSALIRKIVSECFDSNEVCVIEGGVDVSKALLDLPFNHIFFTGGPTVGKSVMRAAAQHLASVTLELGGKSPVIVDRSADLDRAASRIMWYKSLNAGQVCLSCDYILVHEDVKDALVEKMQEKYKQYYGGDATARSENPELSHLVHERHFSHTQALLQDALEHGSKLEFGGTTDRDSRFFDLAVLSNVPQEARDAGRNLCTNSAYKNISAT
ncbi:MAG: aldehyde dehydrogenase family protein [Saprospiraceae bacterium]